MAKVNRMIIRIPKPDKKELLAKRQKSTTVVHPLGNTSKTIRIKSAEDAPPPTTQLTPPPVRYREGESIHGNHSYALKRVAGHGGRGIVFEAWENDNPSFPVALKIMSPDIQGEERDEVIRELRKEEAITARISKINPYIVKLIHEPGVFPDGSVYAPYEFLDGGTLSELTQTHFYHERLPPLELMFTFFRASEALQVVHNGIRELDDKGRFRDARIYHGDISPENFLIQYVAGVVKIGDFGAAGTDRDLQTVDPNMIFGKPEYNAPESLLGLAGQRCDYWRLDAFALGLSMYYMLTGVVPTMTNSEELDWSNPHERCQHVWNYYKQIDAIPPVTDICHDIPEELARIVHGLLEFDPGKRLNVAEAHRMLASYLYRGPVKMGITQPAFESYLALMYNQGMLHSVSDSTRCRFSWLLPDQVDLDAQVGASRFDSLLKAIIRGHFRLTFQQRYEKSTGYTIEDSQVERDGYLYRHAFRTYEQAYGKTLIRDAIKHFCRQANKAMFTSENRVVQGDLDDYHYNLRTIDEADLHLARYLLAKFHPELQDPLPHSHKLSDALQRDINATIPELIGDYVHYARANQQSLPTEDWT